MGKYVKISAQRLLQIGRSGKPLGKLLYCFLFRPLRSIARDEGEVKQRGQQQSAGDSRDTALSQNDLEILKV